MKRIVVTGGRDYDDREHVRSVLTEYLPGQSRSCFLWFESAPTIVHGDASGADRLAAEEARDLGMRVEAHHAEWHLHGKRAGPIRNRQMLGAGGGADLVIAFPGGRGTAHCVSEARRRGIPVREVQPTSGGDSG